MPLVNVHTGDTVCIGDPEYADTPLIGKITQIFASVDYGDGPNLAPYAIGKLYTWDEWRMIRREKLLIQLKELDALTPDLLPRTET